MKNIAVSACLLGDNVRYNGTNKLNKDLIELLKDHNVIKICPEAIFINPHLPIEIKENKAFMKDGKDVTGKLYKRCLSTVNHNLDVDFAILKEKSPTCGVKHIYDGSFTGTLVDGQGILTRIFIANNIKVYSEEDLDLIKKELI